MRCALEPFAGILYDLENSNPYLFVDQIMILSAAGRIRSARRKGPAEIAGYPLQPVRIFAQRTGEGKGDERSWQSIADASRWPPFAACCLLLALVLQAGWGRGYRWDADRSTARRLAAANIDREAFKLPPEKEYAASRSASVVQRRSQADAGDAGRTRQADRPRQRSAQHRADRHRARRRQLHLALIQDKSKNQSAARRRCRCPAIRASWTLTEVKPRSAIFKQAPGGEEVEVELTTAVASQKPSGRSRKPGEPAARRREQRRDGLARRPRHQSGCRRAAAASHRGAASTDARRSRTHEETESQAPLESWPLKRTITECNPCPYVLPLLS